MAAIEVPTLKTERLVVNRTTMKYRFGTGLRETGEKLPAPAGVIRHAAQAAAGFLALGLIVILTGLTVPAAHAQSTLGGPLPNLSSGEQARFANGVKFFDLVWVPDANGFGPVFTNRGCSSCHNIPVFGGSGTTQVTLFGTSNPDGSFNSLANQGGPILQPGTVATIAPTSKACTVPGEVLPSNATIVSPRQTPPVFGLGLIDSIPDATIEANATLEANSITDQAMGIHGVANMAPDDVGNIRPGRFGFKGFIVTLLQFTSFAMTHDLSVTNPEFPVEDLPQGNPIPAACDIAATHPNDVSGPVGPTVETSYFPMLLAPPIAAAPTATTQAGEQTFQTIGCAQCHITSLQTAAKASLSVDFPVPLGSGHSAGSVALSNQTAFLYSDLLLHQMGSELADGVPQGQATGSQWRTTPLWGLSHKTVYLHDGRTSDLGAAIEAHGGEATIVIENYNALSPADQANLLAFLESL
jgi:CxxC motif-containing protein (DUF1111 family)